MAGKKLSFEQSMARLDEIVRHLEKGRYAAQRLSCTFRGGDGTYPFL